MLCVSYSETERAPMPLAQSDFIERVRGVSEAGKADVHLVHHREVQAAHLTVGFACVVEHASALDSPTATAEQNYRQLACVVAAGQHAGAVQEHGIVEQCARSLLDRVEFAGYVRDLLEEELVHLQPVRRVGMGKQVVNHVINAEVGKAQR